MSPPRLIPTITEPVYPQGWPNPEQRAWPWAPREIQVLRERYIPEGAAGCLALLPARSATQVLTKADRLGLKRQKSHERRPAPPPGLDAALRAHYRSPPQERPLLRELVKRFGWPRSWLYLRARELGCDVARRMESGSRAAWSEAELALLRAHPTLGLRALRRRLAAAGFIRSEAAIYARRSRLGLNREGRELMFDDAYSAMDLAGVMGEDQHTVLAWIRCGKLKARRRDDLQGQPWVITHQAARAFLLAYPNAWDHRRCDKWWLIEALAGKLGDLGRVAA